MNELTEMTCATPTKREAFDAQVDVLVVGAGFAGLYALHKFRSLGYSVRGIEAADDVGGTWYWNRYPGARCDVPSLQYSYTWSPELRREWRWSEKYATQPEILRYMQYVATRFDLRPLIDFSTRVTSARFDATSGTWTVRTDAGDTIQARYFVMATGNPSVPLFPKLQGLEAFGGEVYHTGCWPKTPVDFQGKRVGVIGTGSSGVQAIPIIAETAGALTVFQRTPNYSVPARNGPLTEADHAKFEAQMTEFMASLETFGRVHASAFEAPIPPREAQIERYEDLWQTGRGSFLYAFPNILTNQEVNDCAAEFVKQKIRETVKDPKTAAALTAMTSPFGVKRLCVDTNYFATYNRSNVRLVDLNEDPIERVTASGIRTAGRDVPLDMIVFATGFDAMTGALLGVDIRGQEGVSLKDAWNDGPVSYLGLMVHGFPNLFTVTGPGSPSVIGNVLLHGEHHVDTIAGLIEHAAKRGRRTIAAELPHQVAWQKHVAEVAERTLFPKANSWYLGSNIPGKPRVFMPYVGEGYRRTCSEIAADGYRGFQFT